MLRFTLPAVVLAAALLSAPAGAAGKNPGVYVTHEVRDTAACQRACADDGLCMAWALYANSCELSAIVPVSAPADATAFALSTRAPAFATLRPTAPPAPAATPITAQSQAPLATPAVESVENAEIFTADPELDGDLVLLGGPEDGALRLSRN
jgi:hypothetical protein